MSVVCCLRFPKSARNPVMAQRRELAIVVRGVMLAVSFSVAV